MFRLHLARRGKSNLAHWATEQLSYTFLDLLKRRQLSSACCVSSSWSDLTCRRSRDWRSACRMWRQLLRRCSWWVSQLQETSTSVLGTHKACVIISYLNSIIVLEKFSIQFERLNEARAFPEGNDRNKYPRSVTETLTGAHFQRMLMATSPKTTPGVRQTGRQSTGWRPTLSFFHQLGIWPKSSSEWFPWVSQYFIFMMKCCSCQCVNKRGSGLWYSSCKYVSVSGNMSMRMYLCVQVNAFQCLCTDIMCV